MRTPIAHALSYPERIESGVAQLDITKIGQLNFVQPDLQRFPCLGLAFEALRCGGTAPAVLNAANEIAVQAFLDRRIGFLAIAEVIADVMNRVPNLPALDMSTVLHQDALARAAAHEVVSGLHRVTSFPVI